MIPAVKLDVSGERFKVVYHVFGNEKEARESAEDICIEQTVEFPHELIADDDIRGHVFGQIVSFTNIAGTLRRRGSLWKVVISYAIEVTGFELTQLINVIFGNISIKPGIRLHKLELPDTLLRHFKGPRFGRQYLREIVGAEQRALLCTALKPMGLSAKQLADLAYQFALGGVDFIKDDHGLANQPFARFRERVERCSEAVAKANAQTGLRCQYVPSLSSRSESIIDDARFAKQQNAGGLLVAPGLVGFDLMRQIADDDTIALPIFSHPSFIGSYAVSPDSGISHYVLFGQLMRLAGADVTIYPNYGGRFSFSKKDCLSILHASEVAMSHIKVIFPAPAGGMHPDRVPEMLNFYGNDLMFLIGGALHKTGPELVENCRKFREEVEAVS
jgi:S-methyl-5-thioribulose 1-phosphate isomerase